MKKQSIQKYIERNWQLWVLILPALIWLILFCYWPMYGIQLAFRDFDFQKGLTGGNFAGLKYFMQYFNSPMFGVTMRNTFVISIVSIVLGFPMPIILALVINHIKNNKLKKPVQTIVYMPYFISTVVLVSLLQILCSPNGGIITMILRALHIIGEETNILGSPTAFIPLYVLSGIWQSCGWNSIIFIAALSATDPQLYDAAKVDGVNKWQMVRYVELPSILPTILIVLILSMGGILSVGFEKIFLMQNGLNKSVSEVISTYVFNVGIQSYQFSFGTAVGLFNNLINFFCLAVVNYISKRKAGISLM